MLLLLVLLLGSRYGGRLISAGKAGVRPQPASEAGVHAPAAVPTAAPTAAPVARPPSAAPTVSPVRLNGPPMPDIRPRWREQGVRDVEWDRLPPFPGMDMIQTDRGYVVSLCLPSVRGEDICIDCASGSMEVQAVIRDAEGNTRGRAFRRIRLPVDSVVDCELERVFSNGVLRVFVPRSP